MYEQEHGYSYPVTKGLEASQDDILGAIAGYRGWDPEGGSRISECVWMLCSLKSPDPSRNRIHAETITLPAQKPMAPALLSQRARFNTHI